MSVELYLLGDVKRRTRMEFGLNDSPDVNEQIIDKANEALQKICRLRYWTWQQKELPLDISPETTLTGAVTQGSDEVIVSGVSAEPRQVLVVGAGGSYGTEGYIVRSFSGSAISLTSQYRHSTNASQSLSLQTGYIQLPEDCVALTSVHDLRTVQGESMKYLDGQDFMAVRSTYRLQPNFTKFYTVTQDPLELNRRIYLALFPYFHELTTLYCTYTKAPSRLEDDNDEPPLPVEDRSAFYYMTLWYMAAAKRYETFDTYRAMAMDELSQMLDKHDRGASYDGVYEQKLTLDMSATRALNETGEADYSPNII